MNETISPRALVILREMAADGIGLYGSCDGRAVFGVLPGRRTDTRSRVSGGRFSDLPRAQFCRELIAAGFCEPTQAVTLNGEPINANVCYRISELGYDLIASMEPSR
jgi:hypothetical protein